MQILLPSSWPWTESLHRPRKSPLELERERIGAASQPSRSTRAQSSKSGQSLSLNQTKSKPQRERERLTFEVWLLITVSLPPSHQEKHIIHQNGPKQPDRPQRGSPRPHQGLPEEGWLQVHPAPGCPQEGGGDPRPQGGRRQGRQERWQASRAHPQGPSLLPRRGGPCAQGQPQGQQADQAQVEHCPRLGAHPARRPLPWQARRVPQAARLGSAARHWSLQGERRAHPPRQPGLRHRHLDQDRHLGRQGRRQDHRRLLPEGEGRQGQGRGCVLRRPRQQAGPPRVQGRRPEGARQGRHRRRQEGRPYDGQVPRCLVLALQGREAPRAQVLSCAPTA